MLGRRRYTASAWLALRTPTAPLPGPRRPRLGEPGRFPARRTWAPRLAALPPSVPGLRGAVGRHMVTRLPPWARPGRAVAGARPALATGGGVWHTQPREQGCLPPRSMATAAGGRPAGWHGWWSGWKLPLAVTVGPVWSPLAAELPGAQRGDTEVAPVWVAQRPGVGRDGVGRAPRQRSRVAAAGPPTWR